MVLRGANGSGALPGTPRARGAGRSCREGAWAGGASQALLSQDAVWGGLQCSASWGALVGQGTPLPPCTPSPTLCGRQTALVPEQRGLSRGLKELLTGRKG